MIGEGWNESQQPDSRPVLAPVECCCQLLRSQSVCGKTKCPPSHASCPMGEVELAEIWTVQHHEEKGYTYLYTSTVGIDWCWWTKKTLTWRFGQWLAHTNCRNNENGDFQTLAAVQCRILEVLISGGHLLVLGLAFGNESLLLDSSCHGRKAVQKSGHGHLGCGCKGHNTIFSSSRHCPHWYLKVRFIFCMIQNEQTVILAPEEQTELN